MNEPTNYRIVFEQPRTDGPSLRSVLESYVRGESVPVVVPPSFDVDDSVPPCAPTVPSQNALAWWGDLTPRSLRETVKPTGPKGLGGALPAGVDSALGTLVSLAGSVAAREDDWEKANFSRDLRETAGALEREF